MTPEERAKEAYGKATQAGILRQGSPVGFITEAIEAAISEEREGCAKIAEEPARPDKMLERFSDDIAMAVINTSAWIAAAIRIRGECSHMVTGFRDDGTPYCIDCGVEAMTPEQLAAVEAAIISKFGRTWPHWEDEAQVIWNALTS